MLNTYFDNGATSYPKPRAVAEKMYNYISEIGGTYGRSAYKRVIQTSEIVETTREKIAEKLGVSNPEKIVFSFNATSALNAIIFGLNLNNCHILLSPLEHNSVVRPLEYIHQRNDINCEILPHNPDGLIDTGRIKNFLREETKLVIVNHQSNVNGCIQPIAEIKKQIGSIPILIDLAQSLGHTEVFIDDWDIDFAAFTGHKGLLGPTGTGGFFVKKPELLEPFFFGGTGSRSESFEMPVFMPDKFEAGTPNIAGIFGLSGALENPQPNLHGQEHFTDLLREIEKIPYLKCHKANDPLTQGPLFSINHRNYNCSQFADALFTRFQIETRSGLHCAPLAHRTLGTFPLGTVRIAISPYHTQQDLEYLLKSLKKMETL